MKTYAQSQAKTEIPLEFAAIGWTPVKNKSDFIGPRVIIVDFRTHMIPDKFDMSSGAVFAWWKDPRTPAYNRLLELLWIRGEMIADRVPIKDIHNAMDQIPEFIEWIESSNADAESTRH